MAGTLANLTIRVGATTRDAIKGLSTLDKRVKQTKQKFTTLENSTLSLQKGLAIMAGATGAAYAAKKIFDMGSAVEETANKFNVVMGGAAGEMREQLEDLTDTVPLLLSEMEGLAAGTQDLLVPFGVARDEAAQMSVDMVALAGDLASFNNVAASVPLEAMKSALAGSSEPMRRFGVDTREARLEALALSEGLIQAGDELDSAARAQAVFLAIQKDSADAMGDAARTADSAANSMRFFIRDVKQAAENVSVTLVPAMQAMIGEMTGGTDNLVRFTEQLKLQSPVIAAWARFAVEAFKFVAQAIAAPFRIAFNLGQVLGHLARIVGNVLKGDFKGAKAAAVDLASEFTDMGDVVGGIITSFDDMRIASGAAFQTTATRAAEAATAVREVKEEVAQAGLEIQNVARRSLEVGAMGGLGNLVPDGLPATLPRITRDVGQVLTSVNDKAQAVGGTIANSFMDAFSALISGSKSAAEAFADMAKAIIADLTRMIAKAVAFAIISSLIPGFGQVAAGLGAVQDIGARADGGPVQANRPFLVGERGPELFVPRTSGQVVSNEAMGGNAGNVAAEILARVGPPPGGMTPREAARDTYWRELFRELSLDNRERMG